MSKLFIIGNGFDLAHGLKTSYDDFRSYLINDQDIKMDELVIPEKIFLPDGGTDYNPSEVLSLLFYIISQAESNWEKWSNIESSLANLDFSEIFDSVFEILDSDGDVDLWKQTKNFEDLASGLEKPITSLPSLFSEWICTINTDAIKVKKDFFNLIGENDFFLNFNYTDTLEQIYFVSESNICYIHGTQHEKIYFGHGDFEDKTDEFMSDYLGAEDYLLNIHEHLRKNTNQALNDNREFFESLTTSTIKEIYSFGFSFNEIDKIYLEEICKKVDTSKVTWYFHDYDKSNINQFSNVLFHCGYEGEFSTFSCK